MEDLADPECHATVAVTTRAILLLPGHGKTQAHGSHHAAALDICRHRITLGQCSNWLT